MGWPAGRRRRAGRCYVQATTQWQELPLHVPPLAFANSSCAFINASFTSALCS